MATFSEVMQPQSRYHRNAYEFLFDALRYTQDMLERGIGLEEESAHISGQELMMGLKELARDRFGLLAQTVFSHWGVYSTEDFGKIVFELIERGDMRKTEQDQLSDFVNVFDFREALVDNYKIDVSQAFKNQE